MNTDIRTIILLVLILGSPELSVAGQAKISVSPNKTAKIIWSCHDSYMKECDIYAQSDGDIHEVWKNVPEPRVTWHSSNLAQIRVSCGSPCYYSKFYNGKKVSDPIEFVLAVSSEKSRAVHVGDSSLEVVNIFDDDQKQIEKIVLDFSPAASLINVVKEVKVVGRNRLYVRYLSGDDYNDKEKVITLANDIATESSAPLEGYYGFNWVDAEAAKCTQVTSKLIGQFKSCKFKEHGGFDGEANSYKCVVGRRIEYLVYQTEAVCNIQLEIMQANGP